MILQTERYTGIAHLLNATKDWQMLLLLSGKCWNLLHRLAGCHVRYLSEEIWKLSANLPCSKEDNSWKPMRHSMKQMTPKPLSSSTVARTQLTLDCTRSYSELKDISWLVHRSYIVCARLLVTEIRNAGFYAIDPWRTNIFCLSQSPYRFTFWGPAILRTSTHYTEWIWRQKWFAERRTILSLRMPTLQVN